MKRKTSNLGRKNLPFQYSSIFPLFQGFQYRLTTFDSKMVFIPKKAIVGTFGFCFSIFLHSIFSMNTNEICKNIEKQNPQVPIICIVAIYIYRIFPRLSS